MRVIILIIAIFAVEQSIANSEKFLVSEISCSKNNSEWVKLDNDSSREMKSISYSALQENGQIQAFSDYPVVDCYINRSSDEGVVLEALCAQPESALGQALEGLPISEPKVRIFLNQKSGRYDIQRELKVLYKSASALPAFPPMKIATDMDCLFK